MPSELIWRTTRVPGVMESSTGDLRPPMIVEGEPPAAPKLELPVRPVKFEPEVIFPAVQSEPLRLPDAPQKPEPLPPPVPEPQVPNVRIPLPPVIPDGKAIPEPPKTFREPAPPPIVIKPQPAPAPAPVTKPESAQSKSPTYTIERADESTAIWGGYSNSLQPCVNGAVCPPNVPTRHGTYGSPGLKLSRDYHFLDACKTIKPALDETPAPRTVEAIAESNADKCFVSGEYLLWWMNNGNVPVLATTAVFPAFGYLGQPTTTLLLGPGSYGSSSPRSGLRLRAGDWFDDEHCCGIDGSFFFLGQQSTNSTISSSQYATIARPFFAANFGSEFAELVAYPGISTGRFVVEQDSFIWGVDVNLRRGRAENREWFVGFRNVNLDETLSMTEFITAGTNAPDPAGTSIVVRDRFSVLNNFYGGQVGGAGGWRWGNVCLDLRGSVALGVTHQTLTIEGSQSKTRPGQTTQNFTGGLLAVGPNLGTFTRDRFSVLPEATLALGYHVTPHWKAFIGYNVLGWTNVIRPGDQIDRVVDLNFVPNSPPVASSGQARPQPTFTQSDLWIQGIQFGVQGTW